MLYLLPHADNTQTPYFDMFAYCRAYSAYTPNISQAMRRTAFQRFDHAAIRLQTGLEIYSPASDYIQTPYFDMFARFHPHQRRSNAVL